MGYISYVNAGWKVPHSGETFHLGEISHLILTAPKLVKISFSTKDFQRHRQTCSISSLSSIVKMRLAMTYELNNEYLVRRFYELKTSFLSLKKLVWRKLRQRIHTQKIIHAEKKMQKSSFVNEKKHLLPCHEATIQQINCYSRWNQLYFLKMVLSKHLCFVVFPDVFFSSFWKIRLKKLSRLAWLI